jgi:hypothetical protein
MERDEGMTAEAREVANEISVILKKTIMDHFNSRPGRCVRAHMIGTCESIAIIMVDIIISMAEQPKQSLTLLNELSHEYMAERLALEKPYGI